METTFDAVCTVCGVETAFEVVRTVCGVETAFEVVHTVCGMETAFEVVHTVCGVETAFEVVCTVCGVETACVGCVVGNVSEGWWFVGMNYALVTMVGLLVALTHALSPNVCTAKVCIEAASADFLGLHCW